MNLFDDDEAEIAKHLPMAPAADPLDEDDGIFMSWPGGDDASEPDAAQADDDGFTSASDDDMFFAEDDDMGTPASHRTKKEKQKKKKRSRYSDNVLSAETDPDDEDVYSFRQAAQSDLEESTGRRKKSKKQKKESDNEATLSSLKYYKHTKKLKQLVVHRVLPIALSLVLMIGFVLYFFRLQHLNFVNLSGYPAEEVFAATGIRKNDFVFSVSASDIEKKLRTEFPYIQRVTVERTLPDTVNLVFEEDCALFYTQIYDEFFVISESMRVLGRYDSREDFDAGLRAVTLPAVSWAVVGHDLRFFDTSYISFLHSFLAELEMSDIYPEITEMDLSNRFDIIVTYADRLRIFLGDDTYLASNLSFVKSIVAELDEDDTGEINIIDNKTASFSATAGT